MPGGRGAFMAVQQHHARRGDVERQAQQGREQQHGREDAEIERPGDVDHRHHHQHRQRDVESEQHVERQRRQRQHHHRQHRQQQQRRADAPLQQPQRTGPGSGCRGGVIDCKFSHVASEEQFLCRRQRQIPGAPNARQCDLRHRNRRGAHSSGISMCGGAGAGRAAPACGAQLVDVDQDLGDRGVQPRRNLVAELAAGVQRARQRRRLDDRRPCARRRARGCAARSDRGPSPPPSVRACARRRSAAPPRSASGW